MFFRIFLILFFIIQLQNTFADGLRIAAAANIQNAISEISGKFTKETGIKVELITASSGKLSAQITNGAPYDVFISADVKYPQGLYSSGLSEKPEVYAIGSLVLWTMKPLDVNRGFESLTGPDIIKISVPNPDFAPYGRAAVEAIKVFQGSHIILKKMVFAESVTQSNQFIQTGAVDAGFTSLSSVLDPNGKKKGNYWIVNPDLFTPIKQAACVLEFGIHNHPGESEKFFKYLFSDTARKIFTKYGYKPAK